VHQTPADMYKKPGEEVQLNCSHDIQDYERILWYKQLKNEKIQFLGYIYGGSGYPEPGQKYSAVKTVVESGALTVKDLQPEDSAVYFCAVSKHSDARAVSS
uniref:Ig-like domain-containing protein n=1 Tax=Myripristis murdjan TaxID=586833 RepID=A0A667YGF6_9TELE